MRCPISFIPVSELEHPVVFRNQKALVVYDTEHIVTWLRTSRRNPVTNEILNPFTPLKELLLPYRLPHTTDAQLAQTQRLLVENESRLFALKSSRWVCIVFRLALTPLAMAISIVMTVGVLTVVQVVVSEAAMLLVEVNQRGYHDTYWPLSVLLEDIEEILRAQSKIALIMEVIYVRFIHPFVLFVFQMYGGVDCVWRWWCKGLVVFKASPLLQNATRVTAVDVLLLTCE
jgi:hypothetical protein